MTMAYACLQLNEPILSQTSIPDDLGFFISTPQTQPPRPQDIKLIPEISSKIGFNFKLLISNFKLGDRRQAVPL
jgi:hypothetical protein